MLKRVALVAAVAAATLATLVACRPAVQRVTRTTAVAAPSGVVLEQVADLQGWSAWWPAFRRHPARERVLGGPPAGAGATCYWSDPAGAAGRVTLLAAGPARVVAELEDERPAPASFDLELELTDQGPAVAAALTLVVTLDPWQRARALFWSPEREHGPVLEEALSSLREASEASARAGRLRVEREVVVPAPLAVALAALAEPGRWRAFSPFGPEGALEGWQVAGPDSGPGATAYWSGAGGLGRLTVLTVGPDRLELEAASAGAQTAEVERDLEVRLAPEGGGTRVTWLVKGQVAEGAEAAAVEAARLGARLEEGLGRLRQELGAAARPAAERVARHP